VVVAPSVKPTVKQPAVASSVKTPAQPVPMEAPALPISGTKEQRLQQLLQQYKADQITPQEYHQKRAQIIAE